MPPFLPTAYRKETTDPEITDGFYWIGSVASFLPSVLSVSKLRFRIDHFLMIAAIASRPSEYPTATSIVTAAIQRITVPNPPVDTLFGVRLCRK